MEKWQSTLLMVVGGIGPAALTILVLQQYGLIGPDTALLLGLLYMIFISTHVWCRIFSKIPPSYQHEQQVDALPCYEDAVKLEPPSYYVLYPEEAPPLCDGTVPASSSSSSSSCPTVEESVRAEVVTETAYSSPSSSTSGGRFFSRLSSVTAPTGLVTFHRKSTEGEEERLDRMPILGRSREDPITGSTSRHVVVAPATRGPRRHSCPASPASQSPLVSASAAISTPTTTSPASTSSYSSTSSIPPTRKEERKKQDKFYKHFLENIGNPIDYV